MNNKRGVSIYVAIFCLLLFSSLAFIISSLVATHTETATNYLAAEQALHIAEAGAQYSVWYLINKDQYWITEISEKSLGSGTYALKVYDEEDKKVIISTGYVPNGTNPRAKRIVKVEGREGNYGIKGGSHPLYNYAIYTDSADTDSGLQLIFDASRYDFSTERQNDGYADVHSNNDILFKNGSGQVIDGTVYSAGNVTKESWTGTPWRDMKGKDDGVESVCPPYLEDVTREYYRGRAIAQGRYYSGDATFTDTDLELGDEVNPALIYVEGRVEIGNVKYYRPGSITKFGIGTIVSGGGDIMITGPIEPASGNRSSLALVSFFDTAYQYQKSEPPYDERNRTLTIQNPLSGKEKLFFEIPEAIRISYTDNEKNTKNSGFLTVFDFNGNPVYNAPMLKTGNYGYYCNFNTSSLGSPDWHYFKVEIKQDKDDVVIKEILAHFIAGEPGDPQHSIHLYKDSNFSQETSAFDNQADVYLQVYGNSPISSIQVSNYSLTTWPRTPIDMGISGSFRRCRFQLPSLTQDYWYNLKVSTAGTTFYKQIYIKPIGAIPIYVCSHSNNYFRLNEYADLEITGNLTARYGLKIDATTPLSRINVIYDTRAFRDPKKTDPNALPGAVSFNYTWREE